MAIKKFSQPRIYSGGIDITLCNELSKEEQNYAISKDWYIYYKFKDETTRKLKRMPDIKGGCNRYETKKVKLQILTHLRDTLEYPLEKGLNPFESKSILMNITGHSTITALELHLRDIDAELLEDYSHLLE